MFWNSARDEARRLLAVEKALEKEREQERLKQERAQRRAALPWRRRHPFLTAVLIFFGFMECLGLMVQGWTVQKPDGPKVSAPIQTAQGANNISVAPWKPTEGAVAKLKKSVIACSDDDVFYDLLVIAVNQSDERPAIVAKAKEEFARLSKEKCRTLEPGAIVEISSYGPILGQGHEAPYEVKVISTGATFYLPKAYNSWFEQSQQ
jgi:hypothetical protein